jgi:hypothetical protein
MLSRMLGTTTLLCVSSLLLIAMAADAAPPDPARAPASRPAANADHFLRSGQMVVGFSRDMGGSIVHVSTPDGPNLVNVHDPGRLIQQSYYAGQTRERPEHHPAWKKWAWNPIQGGDAFNFTPGSLRFETLPDGRFYAETTGLNWPARNERLRSTMRQWARFESPNVLEVTCEFVSDRLPGDDWGDATRPSHQEVPAAYFVADLTRLVTYRDGQPVEFEHKMWNFAQPLPERWAACVDERGWGIGVYSRDAEQANIGKAGTGRGGPAAAPTMHIAPIVTRAFAPQDRMTYTYYLILGDLDTIRATARRLFDAGK